MGYAYACSMLPVDLLNICEILQFFESKVEVSRLELAHVSSEVQDVTEARRAQQREAVASSETARLQIERDRVCTWDVAWV